MNSIAQLVDITAPNAIPWWPLAPAWYAIFVILGLCGLYGGALKRRQWLANRYRREALNELSRISVVEAGRLNQVLRQAALIGLSQTSRAQECNSKTSQSALLSQTGKEWFALVNKTSPRELFTAEQVCLLEKLNYQNRNMSKQDEMTQAEFERLKNLCERWVREHQFEHVS